MSWVLKRCGVEQASFDGAGTKVCVLGGVCAQRSRGLESFQKRCGGFMWAHRWPGLDGERRGGDALLCSYSQKVIPCVFVELLFLQ